MKRKLCDCCLIAGQETPAVEEVVIKKNSMSYHLCLCEECLEIHKMHKYYEENRKEEN